MEGEQEVDGGDDRRHDEHQQAADQESGRDLPQRPQDVPAIRRIVHPPPPCDQQDPGQQEGNPHGPFQPARTPHQQRDPQEPGKDKKDLDDRASLAEPVQREQQDILREEPEHQVHRIRPRQFIHNRPVKDEHGEIYHAEQRFQRELPHALHETLPDGSNLAFPCFHIHIKYVSVI